MRRHSPKGMAALALLAILIMSPQLAGMSSLSPSRGSSALGAPVNPPKDSPGSKEPAPRDGSALTQVPAGAEPFDRRMFARAKRAGLSGLALGRQPATRGSPPPAATSHYLRTARPRSLERLGCREGRKMRAAKNVPDAIVVLAFGRPRHRLGRWGASLFSNGFHSTSVIERAGHAYAWGYWRCAGRATQTRLQVALGTSNYGREVTSRHGRAWARMVNDANEWLHEKGLDSKVSFAGASDIELGWNGPAASKRWVRGYDSAARWPFYNFGDAAGCPPRGRCLGGWTQEDVWYVSWGARSAWPLPQIYTPSGSMALQWYRLSLYSYQRHGMRMTIAGALSQRAACRQSDDRCAGIDNSPGRAWSQLHRLLNQDSRTAQELPWVTDLHWHG